MRYDAYRYLWPPRPETKIPQDAMAFYQKRGWLAQIKKNGTCTVIFARGDEVIFKTRHDDDHKAWVPQPEHYEFFKGRPQWNVYVAELLHSKVQGIRNHLYLFDQLVNDGESLVGVSFSDRQQLLADRFPGEESGSAARFRVGLGAAYVNEIVSRAINFENSAPLWKMLAPEDEGIVFKNPSAKLASCGTATSNAAWQVKCRRPSGKYSF